jgi:hypothetical protein
MPNGASISEGRLLECRVSADFWANHLGLYSDSMQVRADRYAIMTSLMSAVTGLGAWGTIAASTAWWGQAAVGVMAFAAAAVAVIPKVRGYSDCALKAAPLATEYGHVLGDLADALAELRSGNADAQSHSRLAVDTFDAVKKKKDALRPFPREPQKEIDKQRKSAGQLGP